MSVGLIYRLFNAFALERLVLGFWILVASLDLSVAMVL